MNIWEILGIAPTRDAREIRRAYARQLKTIDQSTELQRFEQLRRAYSRALEIAEDEDDQEEEEPEQASSSPIAPVPPSPALQPPSSRLTSDPDADEPDGAPDDPPDDPPERTRSTGWHRFSPPTPTPAEVAAPSIVDVDPLYRQMLAGAQGEDIETLERRMHATLEDPALHDLEVRERFEARVLEDLFTPRPFRERWMRAAVKAFGWDKGVGHFPARSGQYAQELLAWIDQDALLSAAIDGGALHLGEPLAWAQQYYDQRERRLPLLPRRARIVDAIELMVDRFPVVLRYRFEPEVVEYWRAQAASISADARQRAEQKNHPANPKQPRPKEPWWTWPLLLVLAAGAIAFYVHKEEPRTLRSIPPLPAVQAPPTRQQICERLKALERRAASAPVELKLRILSGQQMVQLVDCRREELARAGRLTPPDTEQEAEPGRTPSKARRDGASETQPGSQHP